MKRGVLGVAVVAVLVAVGAGCTSGRKPGPDTERQPLPRLPELGTVALPTGFAGWRSTRSTRPVAMVQSIAGSVQSAG
jgi:hypothetical protein